MATDQEILEASAKNAEYILKLELEIDKLKVYIKRLRTALNDASAEAEQSNAQAYELLSPDYEKEFGLDKLSSAYTITNSGFGIICHKCGRTSHHPEDVKNRYCGFCHVFHEKGHK